RDRSLPPGRPLVGPELARDEVALDRAVPDLDVRIRTYVVNPARALRCAALRSDRPVAAVVLAAHQRRLVPPARPAAAAAADHDRHVGGESRRPLGPTGARPGLQLVADPGRRGRRCVFAFERHAVILSQGTYRRGSAPDRGERLGALALRRDPDHVPGEAD